MNDEMYSLLAGYFSGHATAEEELTVNNWAAANENNRKDFEEAQKIWEQTGQSETLEYNTEAAWHKVKAAIEQPLEKRKGGIIKLLNWKIAAAVAAAVLLFIADNWWLNQNRNGYETITADIAVKEITLDDGSHVYLRNGASLKYRRQFNKNKRDVVLTGEAFFEIAKNPAKPFEITASATAVTILGTSFSVNTNNSKVEVVVKTGLVRFSVLHDTAAGASLEAGDRAVFENNRIIKQKNADDNFNSWQSGKMVFRSTPIQEVMNTLSNHYKVMFVIKKGEENKIAASLVTTTFTNQPLDAVVKELELITAFHIRKVTDTAYEISSQ